MRVKGGTAKQVQRISSSVTTLMFIHIVQVGSKQCARAEGTHVTVRWITSSGCQRVTEVLPK